jgi:hypothetical protein
MFVLLQNSQSQGSIIYFKKKNFWPNNTVRSKIRYLSLTLDAREGEGKSPAPKIIAQKRYLCGVPRHNSRTAGFGTIFHQKNNN